MSKSAAVLKESEFDAISHLYLSGLHKRLPPQTKVGFAITNLDSLKDALQENNREISGRSLYFAEHACSQKPNIFTNVNQLLSKEQRWVLFRQMQ